MGPFTRLFFFNLFFSNFSLISLLLRAREVAAASSRGLEGRQALRHQPGASSAIVAALPPAPRRRQPRSFLCPLVPHKNPKTPLLLPITAWAVELNPFPAQQHPQDGAEPLVFGADPCPSSPVFPHRLFCVLSPFSLVLFTPRPLLLLPSPSEYFPSAPVSRQQPPGSGTRFVNRQHFFSFQLRRCCSDPAASQRNRSQAAKPLRCLTGGDYFTFHRMSALTRYHKAWGRGVAQLCGCFPAWHKHLEAGVILPISDALPVECQQNNKYCVIYRI